MCGEREGEEVLYVLFYLCVNVLAAVVSHLYLLFSFELYFLPYLSRFISIFLHFVVAVVVAASP